MDNGSIIVDVKPSVRAEEWQTACLNRERVEYDHRQWIVRQYELLTLNGSIVVRFELAPVGETAGVPRPRDIHDRLRAELRRVRAEINLSGGWKSDDHLAIVTCAEALKCLVAENRADTMPDQPGHGWTPNDPVYRWSTPEGMMQVGTFNGSPVLFREGFERKAFAIYFRDQPYAIVMVDEAATFGG